MEDKKKIAIIDGYHMLHKGYYGSLKRKKKSYDNEGNLINALYVFIVKMLEFAEDDSYHTVIVALDSTTSCWRKELYPKYKARRKETPDDLRIQMNLLREFLAVSHIPFFEKEAYEGDDVIGTISKISEKLGYDVEIFSNDKDIYQLVSKNVHVVSQVSRNTEKVVICEEEVYRKMGCKPKQVADLKSLEGDQSDNIRGITSICREEIVDLLSKFETVEEMFEKIDSIEDKKLRQKLINNKERILLNKKITTICTDIELDKIDFRKLNINYRNLLNYIAKHKMWAIMNRTKKLETKTKQRRQAFFRKKINSNIGEIENNKSDTKPE